jgi:hypothetical protein
MRIILASALACVALVACNQARTPTAAVQAPDAVITAMYAAGAQKMAHNQSTDVSDVPMTASLTQAVKAASDKADANQEPFIDGDIMFNCQDCGQVSAVAVTMAAPPANGKATVQARFSVYGQTNTVLWDMAQTPQGWRVDNIRSPDGYDLRKAAQDEINEPTQSCADDRGAAAAASLVQQCTQVSGATHPPCNAANTCAMIEAEIRRGCDQLSGRKPAFCAAQPTDEAP